MARSYEEYSPTVLHDVFHEAGNALIGRLSSLQDEESDPARAQRWADERRQVWRDRRAIDVDDRPAKLAAMARWRDREATLSAAPHLDT